jgi:hypothetical protein
MEMNMTENEQKALTIEDPIDAETLGRLEQNSDHFVHISTRLAELELEKVRILVALRGLAEDKNRIIEKCLVDRGLSPNTAVEINPTTGQITSLRPPTRVAEAEAQPEPSPENQPS